MDEVEFARLGLQERQDIQEWVAGNPSILEENLLIIGKEFSGFDKTNERLDLLAVDSEGRLVVIELKRDDSGRDAHWQAIKYASYLGGTQHEDIVRMFAAHADVSEGEAVTRLLEHLHADDLSSLNNDQRIVIASHRFAPEVTSAALWLNEKTPGQNLMTCVQLTPYHDAKTDSLYIQASRIIPVPGEEDYRVGLVRDSQANANRNRGSFPLHLKETFAKNRQDEVTRFLIGVRDAAIDKLSDELRPEKNSKWAGQHSSGGGQNRYFRLWYSRLPWRNHELCYSLELQPLEKSSRWAAQVMFLNREEDLAGKLKESNAIQGLQQSKKDKYQKIWSTDHESEKLDEAFAETLADALQSLIQKITPIVNEFEEERNEE